MSINGFSLKPGIRIIISFTEGNSASNPKLNINDTGEKNIVYDGTGELELLQGVLYDFVYNGTDYILIGSSAYGKTSVVIRRWTE